MSQSKGSNIINIPDHYIPRDYQLPVFKALDGQKDKPQTKIKRVLLRWHRRTGKDLTCWSYTIKEAFRKPGIYYYLFPTYSLAQKAIWEGKDNEGVRFLDRIPNHKETISRLSNKDLMIELAHNKSIIRLIGTDNYDAIRGTNPIGVVFSEFDYQDPGAVEVVMPMLRANGGWCIFNSTPSDSSSGQMEKLESQVKNNPKWFVSILQTLWPERPHYSGLVSAEDLDEEQTSMGFTDDYMEREYGVSYTASAKGSFYGHLVDKARGEGRIGFNPPNAHKSTDVFMDLGLDCMSMWFRQTEDKKRIFVDYFEQADMPILSEDMGDLDVIGVLADKGYKFGTFYLPWDAGHRSRGDGKTLYDIFIKGLEQAQIDADVVVLDKEAVGVGIQTVMSRFSSYFFDEENCTVGLAHLKNYRRRWDKVHNRFTDTPVHDDASHAADSLRYEAMAEEWQDPMWSKPKNNYLFDFDPLDI